MGLVLAETAVLSVLGPVTGLALVPQVSAPTPFDLFHDLRWLAVYPPSWLVVVLATPAASPWAPSSQMGVGCAGWIWTVGRPVERSGGSWIGMFSDSEPALAKENVTGIDWP